MKYMSTINMSKKIKLNSMYIHRFVVYLYFKSDSVPFFGVSCTLVDFWQKGSYPMLTVTTRYSET